MIPRQAIFEGDAIATGRNETARVRLSDGRIIVLNERSQIVLSMVGRDLQEQPQLVLRLVDGSLRAAATPPHATAKIRSFELKIFAADKEIALDAPTDAVSLGIDRATEQVELTSVHGKPTLRELGSKAMAAKVVRQPLSIAYAEPKLTAGAPLRIPEVSLATGAPTLDFQQPPQLSRQTTSLPSTTFGEAKSLPLASAVPLSVESAPTPWSFDRDRSQISRPVD